MYRKPKNWRPCGLSVTPAEGRARPQEGGLTACLHLTSHLHRTENNMRHFVKFFKGN